MEEKEELLLVSSDRETIEKVQTVSERLSLKLLIKKDIRTAVKASRDMQITIIDCSLPDGNCLECLENLNSLNQGMLNIVVVDEKDRKTAIEALINNAFMYVYRPIKPEELEEVIKRAKSVKRLMCLDRELYSCSLEDFLRRKLQGYLSHINRVGNVPLYEIVVSEVEKALLKLAIEETEGNQLKASKMLGLNRNTVRSKIKKYNLNCRGSSS
ncbi:MAG: response regulator [Nitrospirae bacterium]|nr:MAG: response regulator [Nitrospirota bacterium]